MKQDRIRALVARLSIVRTITLSEAMALVHVSESTARRMFNELERSGQAIRTHGGIRSADQAPTAYSFEYGAKKNIEEKTAIGAEACKYLEDGDVIFCDSGTTIQCFCAELVKRLRSEKLRVKVYTNSLANLEMLSPYLQVNLIGGEYRSNRKDFSGYLAEQSMRSVYFTKCFVGADGCVDGLVFTTTDFDTVRVNEIAIKNARKAYMLVDSSKFDVSSHVAYAPSDKIHMVITDSKIQPKHREQLESQGLQVVCVNAKKANENEVAE